MSREIKDEIRVEIDNLVWTAFESISVTKAMQNLCGSFTLRMVKRGSLLPFANGASVRVLIGSEETGFKRILNGYIDRMRPKHSASEHFIIVSGRDKTQDIFDSTIGGNIVFKAPISLVSLTKQTLSKLGIAGVEVKIDVNVSDLTEADLQFNGNEAFSSFTGERVFDFLSRYAQKKQVLLTTDENGDLLYTRTSDKVINTKLVYSGLEAGQTNILSAEGDFDNSNRYNRYNCYSQFNSTAIAYSGNQQSVDSETLTIGSATDDEIRSSRVYNFIGESPFSDNAAIGWDGAGQTGQPVDDSKNRAIWEANVRRAKSFNYKAEVLGYRAYADGNTIWRPNMLVQVNDDDMQVISQLLTNRVTYTKNLSGSKTLLELVSKDTFDLLEITGKSARKKASERVEGRKFAGTGS